MVSSPLFTLRNVVKTRPLGPGYALCIPHLTINAGEKVGITGPSGCGKSTALDILGLVLRPDSAERFVFAPCAHEGMNEGAGEGADAAALWRHARHDALSALRLRHMGYIMQTGGLLPFISVFDNMALAARAQGLADVTDRVHQLAKHMGIERLLNLLPGKLSVGERQRAAIGRALAGQPRVLFADEPTAALDPLHAGRVMDLLLEAVEAAGVTLILVTHDPHIVRNAALREVHMRLEQLEDGAVRATLEQGADCA